jgi:hypothetical protein
MKVFLSWSGEMSYKVASALSEWLPYMVQSIEPFLSSGDISKGDRWSDVLAQELKDAQYGIICVTPYNIHKPWMNFEAGALSKFIARSCLTPLLFRVDPTALTGPLAQFQSTMCTKNDLFDLVYSINNRLESHERIDCERLRKTFDVWWKELKKAFDSIIPVSQDETRTCYKWLCTFEDLTIHEARKDCESVWIITSDIYKFATKDDVKSLVLRNTKDGIKYRYLIPQSNGTSAHEMEELRSMAESNENLEYKLFNKSCFYSQAATDYVIINASETDTDHPLRVFLKLPVGEGEYWIKADERSGENFAFRFHKLWDSQQSIEALHD